ncbi:hypothetical protein BDZ97DRAFT_1165915 [Flammula alnicola]|nr:hypothetical protein BDZ97DRAFT_1165915 [Flammula alnicola]
MEILRQHIASGAFHDSAERFDPPKCHPQTRQAIIKKIMDWIEDPENLRHFLWMYGPAGCGKSAIAQTIAEMCAEAGILAGSFFFSRTAADRNKKDHFIPSLAYQLCLSISEMRVHVAMAVEHDPTLFSRSLMSKRTRFLSSRSTRAPSSGNSTFLRCATPTYHCRRLGRMQRRQFAERNSYALSAAIKQSSIPLLFLVASRAEHEIRQAFNSSSMRPLMTGLPLDDSYEPDADIRIFLKSKFAEIKENIHRARISPLTGPVPPTSIASSKNPLGSLYTRQLL